MQNRETGKIGQYRKPPETWPKKRKAKIGDFARKLSPLAAHIGGGFFASMKCKTGLPETAKKRAGKVRQHLASPDHNPPTEEVK
jgi:hypothetical protein